MTTKHDIRIPQNGIFRLTVSVPDGPANITGYTGEMQIRKAKDSTTVLATVPGSAFTMNNSARQVVVQVPSTTTALWDWDDNAVYDMYIVNDTERWRLLEGLAYLSKTVTR